MVIVRIKGGLGNQMFQYALYRMLLHSGKEARIDIQLFNEVAMHNGFELKKIFGITPQIANSDEIRRIGDTKRDFFSKARRKIGLRKKTHFIQSSISFSPKVLGADNIYLDGYWQSEKYFMNIQQIIRNDFIFKNELTGKNASVAEKIKTSNSVGLHVRRGDYLQFSQDRNMYNGGYYKKSVAYMDKHLTAPKYFIFSDDIDWCRENLQIKDPIFIEWNKGSDSYRDMQLMSMCKHNIVANSSFSWWGAWLNSNAEKIVVAPAPWFGEDDGSGDIIPESWIKISKL